MRASVRYTSIQDLRPDGLATAGRNAPAGGDDHKRDLTPNLPDAPALGYPGIHHTGGECVGLFYPDWAFAPVPGKHLDYRRDGKWVDLVRSFAALTHAFERLSCGIMSRRSLLFCQVSHVAIR